MKSRRPFLPSYRIKLPITSSAKEGSFLCTRRMTTSVIYSLVTLSSIFFFFFFSFALFRHRKISHSSFPFITICVALCKYNIHFLFSYITFGYLNLNSRSHTYFSILILSFLYRCQMSCQIASIAFCDSCEIRKAFFLSYKSIKLMIILIS